MQGDENLKQSINILTADLNEEVKMVQVGVGIVSLVSCLVSRRPKRGGLAFDTGVQSIIVLLHSLAQSVIFALRSVCDARASPRRVHPSCEFTNWWHTENFIRQVWLVMGATIHHPHIIELSYGLDQSVYFHTQGIQSFAWFPQVICRSHPT